MSLQAARELSIPDLLRVLSEKFNVECAGLRETPVLPLITPASEVESKVRALYPIFVS